MYLLRVVLYPLPMWNFFVQRGMVCSSKLTIASWRWSKWQGLVRRHRCGGAWLGERACPARSGGCRRSPRGAVEARLLAKMVQGHGRDAHVPGALDEVEEVVAGGVGMRQDELGDGAGIAW